MSSRRRFRNDAHAISAARRFAARELADLPAELLEQILLMLSELATNAIRHAHSAFEVEIARSGHVLKVAVTDEGGGTPTLRSPTPKEFSGRGLQIVKMLARDWGIDHASSGHKTVWFTIELAGGEAPTATALRCGTRAAENSAAPAPTAPLARPSRQTRRRPSDPHPRATCTQALRARRAQRFVVRW